MIGKNVLTIDASDFIKGMSSGADINDGGFSNETDAVNLIANPGVLYAPATAVDSDTDTRLTGGVIASCSDMNVISGANRLVVTDDGKAYRYNGTKLTAVGIALTAAMTWTKGFTDIITFLGETYISSQAKLTRWQNDDTIDGGGSWPFPFGTSNVPHPGIVYENNMYWGDKNLLLIQSAVGDSTAPTTILTLDTNQVIMALGIDPGTGLMLISTTNTLDVSNTLPTISKLLWYDGNSAKATKSVIVDDTILGFHSVGGVTYAGYDKNLGYINGSGITFLRKLKNVTSSNTELPYKHNFSHIGNTLHVLDGLQILAYGEVLPGRKVFYYCFKNNVNANKPLCIGDGGNGKLIFGFATTKFYSFDTISVATTNTMSFITHKYVFPRPAYIRGFYIEYADVVANNDANRNLSFLTQAQGAGYALIQDPTSTFSALKNTSGASVYEMTPAVTITSDKVKFIQFKYATTAANTGLRRILVYWDPAE